MGEKDPAKLLRSGQDAYTMIGYTWADKLMVDIDIQHSRKKFEEDGFVILRGFIDPEQVEEIGRRAECVLAKRKEYAERYTNITKGLEKVDDYFDDLMNQGPQVAILTELLGTPPVPVTSSFFTKNKNSEEVHPHSDAMYGGVIWIAIDPTNRENGCLHFIRGSHLREEEFSYLRPHEPNDLSAHPDVVEAVMEPGDIVFFRPTTVHWSGPNHNGSPRRGFNCFYTGDPGSLEKDARAKRP